MTEEKKERLLAKEALAENLAAAETIRQKALEKAEADRKRKIEHDNWLRTTALQNELDRIDAQIAEKTKEGKDRKLVTSTFNNSNGELLSSLIKPDLESRGYAVQVDSRWVEAYRGSSDDGYAYAHDAYNEWTLTIKW